MIDRLRALRTSLRRLLLALLGFVLVAVLTLVILAPEAISDFITSQSILLRLVVLLIIYVVAFFAYYYEFNLANRGIKGLVVRSGDSLTSLSVNSARDRILSVIREVPDVDSVVVDVESERGRAKVALNVVVANHNVNLPDKQNEIMKALVRLVEKQLGLRFAGRPTVNISFKDEVGTAPTAPSAADTMAGTAQAEAEPGVTDAPTPPPAQAQPIQKDAAVRERSRLFGNTRRERDDGDDETRAQATSPEAETKPPVAAGAAGAADDEKVDQATIAAITDPNLTEDQGEEDEEERAFWDILRSDQDAKPGTGDNSPASSNTNADANTSTTTNDATNDDTPSPT